MATKKLVRLKVNGHDREAEIEPRLLWSTLSAMFWD